MIKSIIPKRCLQTSVILLAVDVFIGLLSGLFHNVEFFYQKSVARVASDLAFFEGAAILFIGAVAMFFSSKPWLSQKALVIVGAIMMGMSVILGMLG